MDELNDAVINISIHLTTHSRIARTYMTTISENAALVPTLKTCYLRIGLGSHDLTIFGPSENLLQFASSVEQAARAWQMEQVKTLEPIVP